MSKLIPNNTTGSQLVNFSAAFGIVTGDPIIGTAVLMRAPITGALNLTGKALNAGNRKLAAHAKAKRAERKAAR